MVLTTKHHSGFCMWDTKPTDFGIMHTPYGRDIVRQFVGAYRRHGQLPRRVGTTGGAAMRGDELYLHVFEWKEGALRLPALPRTVTECAELGGQDVTCRQDDDSLVLTLTEPKVRDTHSVVKLTLTEGDEIPLIPVDMDDENVEG